MTVKTIKILEKDLKQRGKKIKKIAVENTSLIIRPIYTLLVFFLVFL